VRLTVGFCKGLKHLSRLFCGGKYVRDIFCSAPLLFLASSIQPPLYSSFCGSISLTPKAQLARNKIGSSTVALDYEKQNHMRKSFTRPRDLTGTSAIFIYVWRPVAVVFHHPITTPKTCLQHVDGSGICPNNLSRNPAALVILLLNHWLFCINKYYLVSNTCRIFTHFLYRLGVAWLRVSPKELRRLYRHGNT